MKLAAKFLFFGAAIVWISPVANAQSINVDFNWNGVGTIPSSSYAAAGLAGTWNNANVSTNSISNLALVNLSGAATTAVLNAPSFGGSWTNTGSWTGDDLSLMEDSVGSGSNLNQVNLSGLLNGNYSVTVYGMAASGNVNSSFTINNTTLTTGGAWAGSHTAGGSYANFAVVPVSSGNLTINWLGNFNGLQLGYTPVPEPATLVALSGGVIALLRRRSRRS